MNPQSCAFLNRLVVLLLIGAMSPSVSADQISTPNTFSNGQVADADEVNANFAAFAGESNAQDLRIATLETDLATTQASLATTQAENVSLRADLDALILTVAALDTRVGDNEGDIATQSTDIANNTSGLAVQAADLDVVEANPVLDLGPYVTVSGSNLNGLTGPHVLLTGANLHVRSGSGRTDDDGSPFGLGNLIVGYDAARAAGNSKVGSHNLVIGDEHAYTSVGGLLAGFHNATTAPWASASGGQDNVASGQAASASAGRFNIASADWSSVVGVAAERRALATRPSHDSQPSSAASRTRLAKKPIPTWAVAAR